MRILAIETSCDETAVAVVEGAETRDGIGFKILGNALLSQIDTHREYGGVYPMLAKREHAKNLVPLLSAALEEAELIHEDTQAVREDMETKIGELLAREGDLAASLHDFLKETEPPELDAIAVTAGPGLEPALWVGVNFAKALALAWKKPLIAVNHLEGHIISAIAEKQGGNLVVAPPSLPLLGLGIAGGHTDLVLMHEWLTYTTVGGTVDDSVGEAFDKVARMLGLPYPGGPEIDRLAARARERGGDSPTGGPYKLPRPMIRSGNHSFSFSGLKTAVMYMLKKIPDPTDTDKELIALEFENAVSDVLWSKTSSALEETSARSLVISGGVSANKHIRRVFEEKMGVEHPDVTLRIPPLELATDNAVMIGLAGYYRAKRNDFADIETLRADGNLVLA